MPEHLADQFQIPCLLENGRGGVVPELVGDGQLLRQIPPGENYLYFTEERGHPRPLFKWRSRYWTFLLKLDPKRPASTIQAQPGPYVGPFHWKDRRLRIPEIKRLQGFPDAYDFAGSRRSIQVQIGNAVPPPLAFVVAASIRTQLEDKTPSGQLFLPLQASLPGS